jgi:drug/metabolite transporter (DMT)-like permease
VIAVGVVLSAAGGPGTAPVQRAGVARAALWSVPAALLFGVNLYALARASQASVVWALWPARIFGTIGVALPLAARGRLVLPGRAWRYAVVSGIAEVTGIFSYALGSRHGTAVPAVVGSQFASLAALGGYIALRERISARQIAGLVTIAVGVAVLAALQA